MEVLDNPLLTPIVGADDDLAVGTRDVNLVSADDGADRSVMIAAPRRKRVHS